MNFIKVHKDAFFPMLDSTSTVCTVKAFKEFTIPANQLYDICLGVLLIHLKRNFVLQIINTHNLFNILNQFWVPSSNLLTLTVFSNTAVSIKINDLLCQIHPLSVRTFLSGNLSFPNFSYLICK
jgi:hypothetical protein